ncbi:MAG: hypothetical protein SOZ80_03955 [Prevotella sp.]|uniref:hypothetical protein n=1 Tax=Prevotella sp. TaxID=59823 RepID=UPI002A25FA36|nr:hypothetical protein [Prevotella sp.]MDD7317311.1 hypothetical protein [Prevotellaceae bacterium]MDY4019915.1 hypothetical protein [Prevotella sp.]
MKKLITMCLMALISLSALAQTKPNRMIVMQKPDSHTGFLVERIDSVFFTTIEGRVAADVTFKNYNTGATGDTVWVSIKKTPDCKGFRIACVPKNIANMIGDDAVAAKYFEQRGGEMYFDDFTNAQMTGFEEPFSPNANYSLITVGYDQYGIACSMSRADFTTPKKPLIGNPQVTCQLVSVDTDRFTVKFTPNSDVKAYSFCSFEKGTAQSQFEMWGPMMGFSTFGDMIKGFCQKEYTEEAVNEWKNMAPGKEYEVVVQAWDKADTYADPIYFYVTTNTLGGDGEATVTIEIKEFGGEPSTGYYQRVIYTPNDQAALHRDIIITKEAFEKPESGEAGVIAFLKEDRTGDPYWDQYGVDDAKWNADPSTSYYACSIAKNAKGEWGPLAKTEFTTPSAPSAAKSAGSVSKRINWNVVSGVANKPAMNMNARKGSFKLEQM